MTTRQHGRRTIARLSASMVFIVVSLTALVLTVSAAGLLRGAEPEQAIFFELTRQ